MVALEMRSPVTHLLAQIVEHFRPRRIILFGSHANGTTGAESDVDLLVVMETRHPLRQAVTIYCAVDHDVPIDLLVRTPEQIATRDPRDLILRSILKTGITVYEAGNRSVD